MTSRPRRTFQELYAGSPGLIFEPLGCHRPTRWGFVGELLNRAKNEDARPVLHVGYPAPDVQVPGLQRQTLGEVFQIDTGEP